MLLNDHATNATFTVHYHKVFLRPNMNIVGEFKADSDAWEWLGSIDWAGAGSGDGWILGKNCGPRESLYEHSIRILLNKFMILVVAPHMPYFHLGRKLLMHRGAVGASSSIHFRGHWILCSIRLKLFSSSRTGNSGEPPGKCSERKHSDRTKIMFTLKHPRRPVCARTTYLSKFVNLCWNLEDTNSKLSWI